MQAFHYAFKIKDIESTKKFYGDILGCKIGRETKNWVDFDFFGHQLSAHVSTKLIDLDYCGLVDGVKVPIPHFGCIINEGNFDFIAKNLKNHQISFLLEPQIRYQGEISEQKTMFILDFSNNAIEFKYFKNSEAIFL